MRGLPPYQHLEFAALTDVGRLRRRNEDAILTVAEHAVFGVCDGMGGTAGGAEASRIVVETVHRCLEQPPLPAAMRSHAYRVLLLVQALREAGLRIRRYAGEHGYVGMGSTATFILFGMPEERRATLLHAGDTLAFRLRGHRMERLLNPHNVASEFGSQARELPPYFQNLLTRAVGIAEREQLEPTSVDVEVGDVFLVASDGLTNMVPAWHIADILSESEIAGVEAVARRLVEAANAAGGRDNISVVVIRVTETERSFNDQSRPAR